MCLEVDANGWGRGSGTHVSVCNYLMQGEYDDDLLWPFRGEITFQLINCRADEGHVEHTSHFDDSASDSVACRVMEGERAPTGRGEAKFIPHSALQCNKSWNTEYLCRSDSLEFRVTRVKVAERLPVHTAQQPSSGGEGVASGNALQPSSDGTRTDIPIPPITMVMRVFISWKMRGLSWISPSFYSNIGGYKMCLRVDANGAEFGADTHVTVGVYLMRGEYDDNLIWPFRGDVTLHLVNRKVDKGHVEGTATFEESDPGDVAGRVTEGVRAPRGQGLPQFISHSTLGYGRNTEFLDQDVLEFRVTSVIVHSS